jgi:hypothetical protein
MKTLFLIVFILLISCLPIDSERGKAIDSICKSMCPIGTFSYEVDIFIHVGYRCYCYPKFGPPKIYTIHLETIENEVRRNKAKRLQNESMEETTR